ncbi:MAG TPA: tetratricopeptide repeat protein, partial [Pyrinomonadaceae bacterium]|nr:tetratricopeptide repeat protein [Pyrinomonadaceae bacterium]
KSEQAFKQSFSELASIELEYLSIYSIGFKLFMDLVRLMKADILSRLNDPRAVEVLGDVNEFISDIEKTLTSGISYRALTGMVMILRDDGQYDKAIEVLNKIEPFATTDEDRIFLYNTAGTLYELTGDTDKAMSYFQQTYDLALTKGADFVPALSMNMASNHIHQGRPAKALELLSSVDIKKDAKSEREVYGYNLLMAQALAGLERYDEAQPYALESLSVIEQARLKLRSFDTRMNWQGEQEGVYRFAVAIAVTNDDRLTAFNLMERSRARAFVDQLAAGHLALPESKKHLEEIEQRLVVQQALLNKLANNLETQDSASFVDYELLAKLDSLNENLKIFEEPEGDDKPARLSSEKIAAELSRLDAALTRIDNEIEEARLLNATNTYGAVLTFPELREVLSN